MSKEIDLKKTMRISVVEGMFAQFHSSLTGIGSNFVTKAAVMLNANPVQFSILTGITQLCQFFQLYAVFHNKDIESRKKPCVMFAFWGRLLSLFIGFSFVIINPQLSFIFFLGLLFLSATLQSISGNMWIAWMSDLIPKKIRGRFFSKRMQIHLLCGFLIGYLFSFLIDLFEIEPGDRLYTYMEKFNILGFFSIEHLPLGLSIVFIIGASLGLYGLSILNRQPERVIKRAVQSDFSLLEPLRNPDFLKLLRFGLWWMFAIGIGAAFWGPFMLKVLKLSLVQLQLYGMLQTLGMLISFRFWGQFIDKFGNKTAMKICVFIGAINPCLWLFFTETSYSLIWVEGFSSGIMWSGANLVTFNFVLSVAPRGKEQHWSALYSALSGLMMMATILLSGFLYPPPLIIGNLNLHPEQVLFGITGILRLSAEIPLYFVNEPRAVSLRKTIIYAPEYVMAKIIKFKDMVFKVLNI